METPKPLFSILSIVFFVFFFLLFINGAANMQARVEESSLMGDAAEMPMAMSLYDDDGSDFLGDAEEEDNELVEGEESAAAAAASRRSLFWNTMRYYISYGALSANRIPCPPRSGRSYYTHNCHLARGPVRPYYRGCSAITRCRR